MKKTAILSLFLAAATLLQAQIVDSIWTKANSLYAAGDYREAIAYYSMIEASGEVSADLFYNIGNAYFKQNILSKAILYYERAMKLRPGDPDIAHNLTMANAMTIDKIEAVPEFFVFTGIKNIRRSADTDTWAWLSILLFALCLLLFGLFLFARHITLRKCAFFLSILAVLGSANCGVFACYQKKELRDTSAAIITPAVITVKSSPDASGKDLFILHEGTKVTILETLGEWQCIRLADGKQGWILRFAAETI
ncbi:MAG: tetratricopeptide repeat protein [Prevotellaceae bacterium]|jgi:tetratricopeptide (TPR) repeat protein|nr:tetratricopeptide repeat protein [Prevotellaceae bacterium]